MPSPDIAAFEAFVRSMPSNYKGPGGAVAIIRDGEVLLQRAWGYADLAQRREMTTATRMPICSISKQFTCAVLLDAIGEPELLDEAFAAYLAGFSGQLPSVRDLCNNQSGLRDYWALTVLCGADPEGVFLPQHAQSLLKRLRTTHFAPGTHYSYCNGNFRILSDLIEQRTGQSLIALLSQRIFTPAGMKTAELIPDTAAFADCTGYEGDTVRGFLPATNRIHWSGDAGIVASLEDMIAWDRFIDAKRDDETGIYRRLAIPQPFADGCTSSYGFGLNTRLIGRTRVTGHGGALRGWRCQRFYAADARLSVIVMFNHQGDASGACLKLMEIGLDAVKAPMKTGHVDTAWFGDYLDSQTGLTLSLSLSGEGQLKARFSTSPEIMDVVSDDEARSAHMMIRRDGDLVHLTREGENLSCTLLRLSGQARDDIEGRFRSDELEADFVCVSAGGALYGAFEGFLGKSPMQPLYAVGPDVWLLPCQRSMDAPAPGDWTLIFERDHDGQVSGVQIGCWLARRTQYRRISEG